MAMASRQVVLALLLSVSAAARAQQTQPALGRDPNTGQTFQVRPGAGTPFDFTTPRPVGERIRSSDEQMIIARGYDQMVKYATALRLGTAEAEASTTRSPSGKVSGRSRRVR